MCNTYIAKPRKGSTGWKTQVSDEMGKLKSVLIRKSDPGVVVLGGETCQQPQNETGKENPTETIENRLTTRTMRWGFHRPFNPSINNARSDKLDSLVWQESFEHRRCLIPVSAYFEWGEVTGGKKQAYEITSPDDPYGDWLWIAGIWEENPETGKSYSMITTAAAASVAFIHSRMPAILPWTTAVEFLDGGNFGFSPFPGNLSVTPCLSPLIRKKPDDGPQQGQLF